MIHILKYEKYKIPFNGRSSERFGSYKLARVSKYAEFRRKSWKIPSSNFESCISIFYRYCENCTSNRQTSSKTHNKPWQKHTKMYPCPSRPSCPPVLPTFYACDRAFDLQAKIKKYWCFELFLLLIFLQGFKSIDVDDLKQSADIAEASSNYCCIPKNKNDMFLFICFVIFLCFIHHFFLQHIVEGLLFSRRRDVVSNTGIAFSGAPSANDSAVVIVIIPRHSESKNAIKTNGFLIFFTKTK